MMSLRFSSASFPDASTDEVFDDRQPSAGDCQDQLDDGFSRLVRAGFHVMAKRAGEVVTANEVLKVRLSNEADQPQGKSRQILRFVVLVLFFIETFFTQALQVHAGDRRT